MKKKEVEQIAKKSSKDQAKTVKEYRMKQEERKFRTAKKIGKKVMGDNFENLHKNDGNYFAYGYSKDADLDGATNISSGECDTPKEAVEKLIRKYSNETRQ